MGVERKSHARPECFLGGEGQGGERVTPWEIKEIKERESEAQQAESEWGTEGGKEKGQRHKEVSDGSKVDICTGTLTQTQPTKFLKFQPPQLPPPPPPPAPG